MHKDNIISCSALVEIQGDFVLRFLKRELAYAEYKIIGFDETIIVRDYRKDGLRAIDYVLSSNNATLFPKSFSSPAYVTIYDNHMNQPVLIILKDTDDMNPDHMLYIAVGLPDEIPIYQYIFGRVQEIENDRYALVGLFQPEKEFGTVSPAFDFCAS